MMQIFADAFRSLLVSLLAGVALLGALDGRATAENYQLRYDVDLSGNDFPFALRDPRFRNVSIETCMSYCDNIEGCVAFTYNENARVCFPKGGTSGALPFKGAISGFKSSNGATSPSLPRQPTLQPYTLEYNVDYSGDDIAEALNNGQFRNIPIETCMAYCDRIDGCVGFTYNTKARVCFPKTGRTNPVPFKGAVSGIRGATVNAGNQAQPITYEKVSSDYLSPDRCGAVDRDIQSISAKSQISIDERIVNIGEKRSIFYSAPTSTYQLPAFLVLTFDQPVRFHAGNFYVLSPQAVGAFSSRYGEGNTRAVIPLFPRSRSDSGSVDVIQLSLSEMHVTAAIISQSGCGEKVAPVLNKWLPAPKPTPPQVVVYNHFDLTSPISSYSSPLGTRYIDVFDGFFRLMSTTSSVPIAEHVATEAAFSPTGRFIGAFQGGKFHLYDSIDGKLLSVLDLVSIDWDNSDSFLLGDKGYWGGGIISSPFIEKSGIDYQDVGVIGHFGDSCHACNAISSTQVRIDLTNNYVISANIDGDVYSAFSLTSPKHFDGNKDDILSGIYNDSGVYHIQIPQKWETITPLIFTHIERSASPTSDVLDYDDNLSYLAKTFFLSRKEITHRQPAQKLASYTESQQRNALYPPVNINDNIKALLSNLSLNYSVNYYIINEFHKISNPLENDGKTSDGNIRKKFFFSDKKKIIITDCGSSDSEESKGSVIANDADVWEVNNNGEKIRIYGLFCIFGNTYEFGAVTGYYTDKNPGVFVTVPFDTLYKEVWYGGNGCNGDCQIHAALFGDRYVAVWSTSEGSISIYDRVNGNVEKYIGYKGYLMHQIALTSDGKYLIQLNTDNTFAIFNRSASKQDRDQNLIRLDGSPFEVPKGANEETKGAIREMAQSELVSNSVIAFGKYDDDELVIWTPDGYFDSTYEGQNQVFLKFLGQDDLFGFNQFGPLLRHKGLMEDVISGKTDRPRINYRIPPMIRTAIHPLGTTDLSIEVSERGGGHIKSILVYQDGLLTDQLAVTSDTQEWKGQVNRRAGARWVSAVAVDAEGLTSAPAAIDIGPDKRHRKLAVLAVGIDEYSDPALPALQFAKTDAFRFSEALGQLSSPLYDPNIQFSFLSDDGATRETILSKIRTIVAEGGSDTDVFLYFSGHGLNADGKLYLGLRDTRLADLAGTALSWTDIADAIGTAKVRTTIFIDTCHSGGAGEAQFTTNDGVANALIGSAGSSLTVFAASKGRQNSLEASDEGGGLFTSALTRVLGKDHTVYDLNGNGTIEATELYRGIKSEVMKASHGQQTPWLAMNSMVGDFALF